MKDLILGTAGHVDHGKTSLVKILTGIDTDRLKEEKERGITIELGFAHFTLPGGRQVGIVDVPGHERFVRTMLAGAAGIDILILVVAADEGVMPQTREHLQICSFLGIARGIVALTKIDLVDAEWLDLVKSEICEFLKGSFLEGAPVCALSAATGAGLEEFVSRLDKIAGQTEAGYDCGIMRLPVDRVFTVKGFGTVATGTMISGAAIAGDQIEVLPAATTAKIRGMQVYNQPASCARAGQRTAINLQGIDRDKIKRGDTLVKPGYLKATQRLDVHLTFLGGQKNRLKHRAFVRLHLGTSETIVRVHLLDREELASGNSSYAQLLLRTPLACLGKDKFVLRSYSPVTTIGGGLVLDSLPRKIKRHSPSALADLELLMTGSARDAVRIILDRAGIDGVTARELVARTGIKPTEMEGLTQALLSAREAVAVQTDSTQLFAIKYYRELQGEIMSRLHEYHCRFPLKQGMSREELRSATGLFFTNRLFHKALIDLAQEGRLLMEGQTVTAAGHQIDLKPGMEDMKLQILASYLKHGLAPPDDGHVLSHLKCPGKEAAEIFRLLAQEGRIVRIRENYYLHRDVLADLEGRYVSLLQEKGRISPSDFKEMTGLSRKYLIPLLEYFDMTKLTIRAGDHRILKARPDTPVKKG